MLLSFLKFVLFFYIIRFIVNQLGLFSTAPQRQYRPNSQNTDNQNFTGNTNQTQQGKWHSKPPAADDYIEYEEVK
jgi:hypothetical protein